MKILAIWIIKHDGWREVKHHRGLYTCIFKLPWASIWFLLGPILFWNSDSSDFTKKKKKRNRKVNYFVIGSVMVFKDHTQAPLIFLHCFLWVCFLGHVTSVHLVVPIPSLYLSFSLTFYPSSCFLLFFYNLTGFSKIFTYLNLPNFKGPA